MQPANHHDCISVLRHVGIIMDGNGRWAQKRNLSRHEGHRAGKEIAKCVIKAIIEYRIPYLTLYCFSTENWSRPQEEIDVLMEMILLFLSQEHEFLNKNNISLTWIGDRSTERIDRRIKKALEETEEQTRNNTQLKLFLAFNYGSHQEIINAFLLFLQKEPSLEMARKNLSIQQIESCLNTCDAPNPDLIIRTGGEKRLSNFLLWQSAYSELFFSQTLWPDFTKEELYVIFNEFYNRKRRFGK